MRGPPTLLPLRKRRPRLRDSGHDGPRDGAARVVGELDGANQTHEVSAFSGGDLANGADEGFQALPEVQDGV
eukprot:4971415-Pyramimonas_sp.AAC.2